MRQAGRSLPEYREIRERYGLFEICRQPELTAEVTLQPVRRHDVDAAVMFSDIMIPVLPMGIDVELVEGVGPVVADPIGSQAAVDRLRVPEPEVDFAESLSAVTLVRSELDSAKAVIGFVGGPFTVAGYLIEGRSTRDFVKTKACMYGASEVWHGLMEKLTQTFTGYLEATVRAGADVVQLFDSWVGNLSADDYGEFVAPYSTRILETVGIPTIHFGTSTAHLLPDLAAAGGDVIGLDWRVRIADGWRAIGDRGVQGNLDPALLLGPFERVERAAATILESVAGRPGHVFNLGHGVLPATDPEALGRLVEVVRDRSQSIVSAEGCGRTRRD